MFFALVLTWGIEVDIDDCESGFITGWIGVCVGFLISLGYVFIWFSTIYFCVFSVRG